jgi:hypothetical protein
MTGNPEVMDQVGRRGTEGGNAVRRLLCMPVGAAQLHLALAEVAKWRRSEKRVMLYKVLY